MAGIKTIPLKCALKEHYYEYDYQKSIFIRGSLRYSKWSCFVRNDYTSALKWVLGLAVHPHSCVIVGSWKNRTPKIKYNLFFMQQFNFVFTLVRMREPTTNLTHLWCLVLPQWWEARASITAPNKIHVPILIIYNIPGPTTENLYYFMPHLAHSSCLHLPSCNLFLGLQLTGLRNGNTLQLLNFLSRLCKYSIQ